MWPPVSAFTVVCARHKGVKSQHEAPGLMFCHLRMIAPLVQRHGGFETLRRVDTSRVSCEHLTTLSLAAYPTISSFHCPVLQAHEGIETLRKNVDTLIVIPNDRLLAVVAESTALQDAFLLADDVLRQVSSRDQQQVQNQGG